MSTQQLKKHRYFILYITLSVYLIFRIAIIAFTASRQSIPFDLNDHYAYALKNTLVNRDFCHKNPNLLQLKNVLLRTIQNNPKGTAVREYHQIFCLYHPLYTFVVELVHRISRLPYKKCLFVMQCLSNTFLGVVFLFALISLGFGTASISGVLILAMLNWGMHCYFFYGMPKHFLAIMPFLIIIVVMKYKERPIRAIGACVAVVIISALIHVMAYAFVLIPIFSFCAYGLINRQRNYAIIGITLVVLIFCMGFIHKGLIDGGYLPGFMANWTPYADANVYFSTKRMSTSIARCLVRLKYFSNNYYYYSIFFAGFVYGIWCFFKQKKFLIFWIIITFNFVPIVSGAFLNPVFSSRLLPMALLLDLAVMCSGLFSLFKSLNDKISKRFHINGKNRILAVIAFVGFIMFMNFLEMKTFLRNFRSAAYGQCYDTDEALYGSFAKLLGPKDVIGFSGGEYILLPSIYNGLIDNPIVYARYYDDDFYEKSKHIDKMTYCIGIVPWFCELGSNNSLKSRPGDRINIEYYFKEPLLVNGIYVAGENLRFFSKARVFVGNKFIDLKRRDGPYGCSFKFPKPKTISGICIVKLNNCDSPCPLMTSLLWLPKARTYIRRILWSINGYEHPGSQTSFNWDFLRSIEIVLKKKKKTYEWKNTALFGDYEKEFTVVNDDGFSFIAKVKR